MQGLLPPHKVGVYVNVHTHTRFEWRECALEEYVLFTKGTSEALKPRTVVVVFVHKQNPGHTRDRTNPREHREFTVNLSSDWLGHE